MIRQRSADFQVRCVAGLRTCNASEVREPADLEIGDTAGLETCDTWRCKRALYLIAVALVCFSSRAATVNLSDDQPLQMPTPGAHQLHLLTPEILELTLITTKDPDPARVKIWDFVEDHGKAHLPSAQDFQVRAGAATIPVQAVGFKRRVLYAPLKERDLRIANYLYLRLTKPVAENVMVDARNPSGKFWPS